jgi:hypothetical protein
MKRILTVLATALLTVGCSAAAQESGKAPTRGDIIISAQLAAAEGAAQHNDPDLTMSALNLAMRDDMFAQLSPDTQYKVAKLYGLSAQALGLASAEHVAAVRATANPRATNEDWNRRMHSAIRIGDAPDAYLAFQHINRGGNRPLSNFSGRQIDWFDRLLGDLPNGTEARIALGREMEAEQWEPPYVYNDPSLVRLHYAEALLEKGDLKKARAVAARITDPVVVMAMRSDRRFDAIVADVPALQDPVVVAHRYLQWARDYTRQNPRMLSGRIAVMRALTILNKTDEALAYADETVEIMMHGSRGQAAFDDMEEVDRFEGWKAATLISAGRVDAGIAGLTTAASCNCSALAMIQLGRSLMEAGHPKEARRWIIGINELGLAVEDRMTMSQTRACVAAQLGDQAAVAKELEFLGAHESWKPGAMVGALVCADRLDAAAAVLAKQIADPRTRLAALSVLQAYAAEPGDKTYAATLRARWATLAAMPAVQAEVAKVGRFNRYELQARDALA